MPTHEVLNQAPPLQGYDPLACDLALLDGLRREGAGWAETEVGAFARRTASPEVVAWGFQANENRPRLCTHDRFGTRIDEVEFHPAWHELMRLSIGSGVHSGPWRDPREGAHVARAAKMLLVSQAEAGHGCPISMTYSAFPALQRQPDLLDEWAPRIVSLDYDGRMRPAVGKRGGRIGMGMTEKQGGSDVRANTTRAEPLGSGAYALTGHKWFCSAPMSDAFLVLAQAPRGLSCFLLPRWTPDGERNGFHIQRLKDKLGNRSNASSEVEFDDAWARLVGDEGRGVPTIIEMVNYTRLDCVLGSAGLMRAAVAQATHHTAHREVFGKLLIDQPLMRNVLADLCIESEAATLTAMRLARACDEQDAFKRLGLAVSKYWVCKSAVWHVGEALECLGGNGYVELSGMPRLFREAPLNSIWEGSGNVNCLDVLRGMVRSPESVDAFFAEVDSAGGEVAAFSARIRSELSDLDEIEYRARRIVESMAIALQASLLVRHGDEASAAAFVATRLKGDRGRALGTLPAGVDCDRIIERQRPHL